MEKNRENWSDEGETLRSDKYDYCDFPADGNPEGVLIAQQIQAQSYINKNFVHTDGLITLEGGEQVLAPDIANPADADLIATRPDWTEYSIGVAKANSDLDPLTGEMVAWKKRYAPLDALPTYTYCKDHLWPGWEEYLRTIDMSPTVWLAEPEALGKTINAGKGVVTEFMRNEIQRVYGKNEVWFMGLVEKTVFQTFIRNWGPLAVEQIGEAKRLEHPMVSPDVKLVPTLMDIDKFYLNFYYHLQTLQSQNELTQVHLNHFLYMTSGISDEKLGKKVARFRASIRNDDNDD